MEKEKNTEENQQNNENENSAKKQENNKELQLNYFLLKNQNKESYLNCDIIPLTKLKFKAAFPTYLNLENLEREDRRFLHNYKINKTGIICTNKEIVDAQAGIFKDIAIQLAKNIFKGGGVVSLSLPIRVFEDKSMLEKYCDWWVNAPELLTKAGKTKDPIEAMKKVICFSLSSLHFSASQLKPFNPILGETLQVELNEGTKIYLEHTSHHPCITNFYILDKDKNFTISGYYDMQPEGTVKMVIYNYVYLLHKGKTTIHLKTTNQNIDIQIPKLHFGGIVVGERYTLWDGFMKFEDKKNNLKAIVQFNIKNKDFHQIQGEIFKHDYEKDKKKDFYESFSKNPFCSDPNNIISKVSGSYLETIYFDDTPYFDVKNSKLNKITHEINYVLPSDARYREDVNWLSKSFIAKNENENIKKECENYAQEWKLALEAQQRHDKKLRESKKRSKWSF